MVWTDVWVTSAEDDAEAGRALRLARSLRKTLTAKKVLVVPGIAVSHRVTEALGEEFDGVLPLDVRKATKEGATGDFEGAVKITLHGIRIFRRAIFLSSSVVVVRNVDFMFDKLFDEECGSEGEGETSVDLNAPLFAVSPSLPTLKVLLSGVDLKSPAGSSPRHFQFEKLQKKAARLFSTCGISLGPSDVDVEDDAWRGARMVRLPVDFHPNRLSSRGDILAQVLGDVCAAPEGLGAAAIPLERMAEEPIAIVGMACRLPGSNDVEEFWRFLVEKGDAVTRVPAHRWPEEQVKEATEEHRVVNGSFLKCPVDEFDGKFFGMSPKELEFTDPQQRLLLEVSWEALEDAAVDATELKGTQTGIFTGTWTHQYTDIMNRVGFEENEFFRKYIGNSYGATAGRMAYFYGTTGSNIATESGCSGSIVAVGLACKSLRRRETSMALACGVNLILEPFSNKMMEAFCAEDGHSKTFDASADGFGKAEGCGVLVLKRLSDAVADGDNIRAVIRGYGEAQEGPSRSLGTPTVDVEALAMRLALKDAQVLPWEVSAVEAHGTGTPVGDPMEMEAIAQVYSPGRTAPLIVTSVKTNVGHTESCSGITGIIKTVLSMERALIPPHRALPNLNPKIDLSACPALIPLSPTPWPPTPHAKRIVGVSSFGITGTDAHVILQEAPAVVHPQRQSVPFNVLALSALSDVALKELVGKYETMLRLKSLSWSDVTFTANTGRAHFDKWRSAVVASDAADFLRQVERKEIPLREVPPTSQRPKTVFLFTGYGSQYCGMAKELYESSPDFRRNLDKCGKILRDKHDVDVKRVLWDSSDPTLVSNTVYTAITIFVVEFCVAELWKTWGVTPDVIVGHSLGEYAAACVAGVMSVEDTLMLITSRGQLLEKLPHGKMIVVKANLEETKEMLRILGPQVSIDVAAVNSAEQTTLAGTEEDILTLKTFCVNQGVKSHVLDAVHAFHSHMMEPALPELRKVTQHANYGKPTCVYISGMEGKEVTSLDFEYWVRHTRQSVNFVDACEALKEHGDIVCVEVGPTPILSSFVARNFEGHPKSPTLLPSLRKNQSDWRTMTEALARLYTLGVNVNWAAVHRHAGASKLPGLPTYPFQRKKFWFTKPKSDGLLFSGNQLHPLVNFRFSSAAATKTFQSRVSLEKETYVKDHVVGSHVIFPAAGYVEMILAAGHSATLAEFEDFRHPRGSIFVRDLVVESPLGLREKEEVYLQTIVAPPDVNATSSDVNWNCVTIHRQQEDATGTKSWVRHASAKFSSFSSDTSSFESPETIDVDRLKESRAAEEMGDFYAQLNDVGLRFGETFRSLRRVWRGAEETLAEVVAPPGGSFLSHPVAIDAMIQALMAAAHGNVPQLMVPVKIESFSWFAASPASPSFFVHVDREASKAILLDDAGRRLAVMGGVTLVPTSTAAIDNALESQKLVLPKLLEEQWVPANISVAGDSSVDKNFFDTEAFKELVEWEGRQEELSAQEQLEETLLHEVCALQGLHALLQLGWAPKVDTIVDIPTLVDELQVNPKWKLFTRRLFEIFCRHTEYVEGSKFDFRVTKSLPSIEEIDRRISEIQEVLKSRAEFGCVRAVAAKTAGVLRGRDSVLPILFGESNIAEKVYTNFKTASNGNLILVEAIKRIAADVCKVDKTRRLRILEIGGGTGGSTRSILPALEESGVDFAYTFTDVSAGFFSAAEASFAQWRERMEFRVLDVEKDPKTQGFLHEDFDVVIAVHVLHATRNMTETMGNVRHLLRPNGLALVGELYGPFSYVDMIFGLVDGYWIFEDFDLRPYHCILPETAWPQLLSTSGFASQRLLKVPGLNCGVVVSQATSTSVAYSRPTLQTNDTWIVARGSPNDDFAFDVTTHLEKRGRRVIPVFDVDVDNWVSELESGRVEGVLFTSMGKNFDATESTSKFLRLLQKLVAVKLSKTPKLALVTKGTVVVGDQSLSSPHGGALWGMSRTFRSEYSNYSCVNVDVDPHDTSENNAANLLRVLWNASDDFIAVRRGRFHTARLENLKVRNTALQLPLSPSRFELVFPKTNAISDLTFRHSQRRQVEGNCVEVTVKASALNFRDLFSVLKPSKAFEKSAAVGTDMAGVVTAVGPDVQRLKLGDAVIGCFFDFGGLPSHIVVPEGSVVRLPRKLTFADGATLPAVFTTAFYCLVDVARLRKGETVLIHTASGGVGLAAIQLARDIGARIVATAGSRRKRAYLREVVGIEDVFHSRDLTYTQEIRRVTGGRGVDVVLNSLTGPGFKEASLDVCVKNGRFVEMSKLNIWSEDDVAALRPDVEYTVADLTSVSQDVWKHLLFQLDDFLKRGKLAPLPVQLFESVEIRAALTHLQKARHIGKIVCKMPEEGDDSSGSGESRHRLFNARSSYLISGGLGGIGLEAAKWMAGEGAKFLVLCGRRPPSDKAANVIAELNVAGKAVVAVQVDVGNWDDCKRLVDSLNSGGLSLNGETFPPLRGIQHAAGCLSDGMFPNQTWAKYADTFNGKVNGAWNLHRLTMSAEFPLEHFVMYSSVASVFGTMGQSNHAAGNGFLDALTHFRNARGLPATSINWGQWGQVGVAADMELRFCAPFTPLQGFASLKEVLRSGKTQLGVVEADFSQLSLLFPWAGRGYWKNLVDSHALLPADTPPTDLTSCDKFWEEVGGANGEEKETQAIVSRLVVQIVRSILKMDASEAVEVEGDLQDLGLDSLMMVELKNLLQGGLGSKVTLKPSVVSEAKCVRDLAHSVWKLIGEAAEDDVGAATETT